DRICGEIYSELFERFNLLRNFDYEKWGQHIVYGQQGIKHNVVQAWAQQAPMVIGWNPKPTNQFNCSYCIKAILEDGTERYIKRRARIQRFSKKEAEREIEFYHSRKSESDPFCYGSESDLFGKYSSIARMLAVGEKALNISELKVTKYSKLFESEEYESVYYYAPLFYLVEAQTEELLAPLGKVFLFSNPLNFSKHIESLNGVGVSLVDFTTHIIATDSEFDTFMKAILQDGLECIIDPVIGKYGELIKGLFVKDLNTIIHDYGNNVGTI
ncbi:MAG: hypothetical protein ACK5JO_05095, partial [Halodesulfovibrio sp.]